VTITNGYTDLNTLKLSLKITDTVDDAWLTICINAASRAIDNLCERVFYQTSATRVYAPNDNFVTEIDDLVSITTLKTSTNVDGVFDQTWQVKDYQLEPLNGIAGGIPSPATLVRAVNDYWFPTAGQEATVQIVGVFGWAAVPDAVEQACLLQSARYYKRADSPMGVAGFGDGMGVIRLSRIDPDIATLLEPYQRIRMA
jgi:hypothetical protein